MHVCIMMVEHRSVNDYLNWRRVIENVRVGREW